MKLKIGMIVSYKPTAYEMGFMKERQSVCNIKETLPAIIVAIDQFDDEDNDEAPVVNLKVLLDGQGDIWAKDVKQGDEVGQWKLFEFEEDEENAFLNEITALIVKLAQQNNELVELLDSVHEDIESSKIILAAIQEAKVEPTKQGKQEVASLTVLGSDIPKTTDAKKV